MSERYGKMDGLFSYSMLSTIQASYFGIKIFKSIHRVYQSLFFLQYLFTTEGLSNLASNLFPSIPGTVYQEREGEGGREREREEKNKRERKKESINSIL